MRVHIDSSIKHVYLPDFDKGGISTPNAGNFKKRTAPLNTYIAPLLWFAKFLSYIMKTQFSEIPTLNILRTQNRGTIKIIEIFQGRDTSSYPTRNTSKEF